MSEEQRPPQPDRGVHDPEMTEPDEANAPDVDEPDHDKLTREIDQEGEESA
jgi:hypothetical protein